VALSNTICLTAAIMELHRPLGDHQARCGPLASVNHLPSADYSSYGSYAYASSPYTYSLHHATQLLSPSPGTSSGIQFFHDTSPEETRSRKRRKIGGSCSPLLQTQNQNQSRPVSNQGASNNAFPHSHCQHYEEDQNLSTRQCVEMPSQSHSYNLSLSRGMASLSQILCPCCGFGWHRSGGHQHVPDSRPDAMYDSKTPYIAEKPPLMQPPMSTTGESLLIDVGERPGSFSYSESPSATSYHSPVFPALSVPMVAEESDRRTSVKYEHSPVALARSGSRLPAQDDISPISPVGRDRQPIQESKIVAIPGPLPLQHPPAIAPYNLPMSQMAIAKHEPLDLSPMEGWNGGTLDQRPYYDILAPGQRGGGKRGPFKTLDLREQTAQTRRIGSCIRCRMQRIRCDRNADDPDGDCATCNKVTKSKAGRFPCLRYKITDIRMYKPGPVPGYEWTRRWNNNISDPIQRWASPDTKIVRISEGYSRQFVELKVRKFVPQEGDKLERTWDYNGAKRSVTCPPFAIVDLDEGVKAYQKYICNSMSDTFPRILGPKDALLYRTYLEAWRLCRVQTTSEEALELLSLTFRLWMSIRLSTASIFIIGDETLGMPKNILDDTNPHHGKIPVPPVMGAQTDLILIHHVQAKLRRDVLDKLQKIILTRELKPTRSTSATP
jgi:hypothetical protein